MAIARIENLDFKPGHRISRKYEIVRHIGGGWEGEVYIIRETSTGIERAAKFFYPQRNKGNKTAKFYAQKLHKLRNCSIFIQYLNQEVVRYKGQEITCLISEYVEGLSLKSFIETKRGQRLPAFQALHLLHALARGMEEVHSFKEYHGDIHLENILINRYGLNFHLKLIDMFQWGTASPMNIRTDVCDMIRVFYDVLGGKDQYAKQPKVVKQLCCGLKRSLILKKFKTAGQLRLYLENLVWED